MAALTANNYYLLSQLALQLGLKPVWSESSGDARSDVNGWLGYALSDSVRSAQLATVRQNVQQYLRSSVTPDAKALFDYYSWLYSLTYSTGYTTADPAWFRDPGTRMTLTNPGANQYYTTDAFPRVVVLLPGTSTSFTVEAVFNPSVSITSDPQTNVAIRTSTDPTGAGLSYNQTVTAAPPLNTRAQVTIALPAGTRYVELTGNAYITGISAPAYYVVVSPPTVRQLVIWGDSISTGNIASPVFLGFSQLTRYGTRFDSVDVFGVSGDSLFNWFTFMGGIAATAAALVTRAQRGSLERVIFIEMGTNDYGLGFWNAAAFGAAYASLLDAIRALDPTVRVCCLQSFHRSSEGINGAGSTLADYRAAVATAVSTRTAWCKVIDGFTAFTQAAISAMGDGLHPGTALHAIIASWLTPQL